MANVLGELFQNIANSIRSKTGSTAKLSPNEFASAISSIVVGSSGSGGSGGSVGDFEIATGSFTAPALDIVQPEIRVDQCTLDSRGFSRYVSTPATCVLQSGVTYGVQMYGEVKFLTAAYSSAFGSFESCVVIGNKSLAQSTAGDTKENFLFVYEPSKNTSTLIMQTSRAGYDKIFVYNPATTAVTTTVTHGKSTMPDYVIVWSSALVNTAFSQYNITSAWGLKSSFNNHTNVLAGYTYGQFGTSSATAGLDNGTAGNGYIYCPNKTTFVVGKEGGNTLQLVPNGKYKWLAMWGIGGTLPPYAEGRSF